MKIRQLVKMLGLEFRPLTAGEYAAFTGCEEGDLIDHKDGITFLLCNERKVLELYYLEEGNGDPTNEEWNLVQEGGIPVHIEER